MIKESQLDEMILSLHLIPCSCQWRDRLLKTLYEVKKSLVEQPDIRVAVMPMMKFMRDE